MIAAHRYLSNMDINLRLSYKSNQGSVSKETMVHRQMGNRSETLKFGIKRFDKAQIFSVKR